MLSRLQMSGRHAYLFLVRMLGMGLGVLQLSAVSHLLSEAQFAAMASTIALASYIQLLADPPILGYQRAGSSDRSYDSEHGEARQTAYSLLLPTTVVMISLGLAWGTIYESPLLGLGMGLWGVSLVQLRWVSVQFLNWQAQRAYVHTLLINSLARAAAVSLAALAFSDAGLVLLVGGAASFGVTAIVAPSRPRLNLEISRIKHLLAIGLPMTIASAARTSLVSWPILAGSMFFPTDVFARFAAQTRFVMAAFGVTVGLVTVFGFPRAKMLWDSGDRRTARSVVPRYLKVVAVLSVALIGVLWFMGDWITGLVLGQAYAGHVLPAVWIVSLGLGSATTVASWILQLKYQQRHIASVRVVFAILQIPIVAYGASNFGVPGLVTAVILVNALQMTSILLIARRSE